MRHRIKGSAIRTKEGVAFRDWPRKRHIGCLHPERVCTLKNIISSGARGKHSAGPALYITGMCGRATYKLTWEEIVALYRLTLDQPPVNTRARYNVCPTTTIDTIVGPDGKRELVPMRWGLIPSWWSKPLKELKLATFNARAASLTNRPT